VSGSGISWVICKSAPWPRHITTPASHHLVFLQTGCPSCRPTNSVTALKARYFSTLLFLFGHSRNNIIPVILSIHPIPVDDKLMMACRRLRQKFSAAIMMVFVVNCQFYCGDHLWLETLCCRCWLWCYIILDAICFVDFCFWFCLLSSSQ